MIKYSKNLSNDPLNTVKTLRMRTPITACLKNPLPPELTYPNLMIRSRGKRLITVYHLTIWVRRGEVVEITVLQVSVSFSVYYTVPLVSHVLLYCFYRPDRTQGIRYKAQKVREYV